MGSMPLATSLPSLASFTPDLLIVNGNYISGTGVWSELNGHDLTTANAGTLVNPPDAGGGIPLFIDNLSGSPNILSTAGWTINDWATDGDHHLFCVFTPGRVFTDFTGTDVRLNESPFYSDSQSIGFTIRFDTGIYYCDFFELDTDYRKAEVVLGSTLSKFVIQGKKTSGHLWIKLSSGSWIMGDACGNTDVTSEEAVIGGGGSAGTAFSGTVHALASWKRILSSGESDAIAAIGAAIPSVPFTPALISPTAWFRAPFTGDPWMPTNTFPVHGNLTADGAIPSIGADVHSPDGLTSANFNGTTQGLETATASAQNIYGGVGNVLESMTVVIFFRDTSPHAPAAAFYDEADLASDTGSHWGLSSSTSGIRAGAWGGGTDQTTYIPLAAGTWAMAVMRHTGPSTSIIKCRVSQPSGTTDQSVPRTPTTGIQRSAAAGSAIFGINYTSTAKLTGDIVEIITFAGSPFTGEIALTDDVLVAIRDYLNTKYGKGLI